MSRRQHNHSDIGRAVRSWAGSRSPTGDDAAGVESLTRELMKAGLPLTYAARAAAVMAADGIGDDDRWTGPLSHLSELGSLNGIKQHRATSGGSDRYAEVDVGRVYHVAVIRSRMARRAAQA